MRVTIENAKHKAHNTTSTNVIIAVLVESTEDDAMAVTMIPSEGVADHKGVQAVMALGVAMNELTRDTSGMAAMIKREIDQMLPPGGAGAAG